MQISPLYGWLVSALSIPIGGEWLKSSADFNPNHNHVNVAPKQTSLQTTSRPHHHATSSKINVCKNVLVSLQICEVKNQKEWHRPPNISFSLLVWVSKSIMCDFIVWAFTTMKDISFWLLYLCLFYGSSPMPPPPHKRMCRDVARVGCPLIRVRLKQYWGRGDWIQSGVVPPN
jgi:hypothetical protein